MQIHKSLSLQRKARLKTKSYVRSARPTSTPLTCTDVRSMIRFVRRHFYQGIPNGVNVSLVQPSVAGIFTLWDSSGTTYDV